MDFSRRDWLRLFDVEAGAPEGFLADIAPSAAERVGRYRYMTRRTLAGEMQYIEIYPVYGPDKRKAVRAARAQATPEQIARANQRARERRLAMLLDTNFGPRDYFVTLTYAHDVTRELAQQDVRNFLRRVGRIRDRRGLDKQRYIYCLEDSDGEGGRVRTHIHLVISGGLTREELEQIWGMGYANALRLQPDSRGLEGLAKYLLKAQGNRTRSQSGRRSWSSSRNLEQPQVRKRRTGLSTARVRRMAEDAVHQGQEELERMYPGYDYIDLQVRYSDVTDGVYLEAVMRRKRGRPGDKTDTAAAAQV